MQNDKLLLLPCPFCGKEVEIHGGAEEWTPSFYDPDSGGDPYYINCECGLFFSIGVCDATELVNAWNTRKPMERIVEQLEEESDFFGGEPMGSLQKAYYCKGIKKAIEIVKGGVDNAE